MGRMINLTPKGVADGTGTKKTTIKSGLKIGPVSLNFVTIVIVALVTLFYLAQTQLGTAKRNEIKELVSQQEELEREAQSLEVDLAKLRSIHNLQEKIQGLNMIPADKIIYILNK